MSASSTTPLTTSHWVPDGSGPALRPDLTVGGLLREVAAAVPTASQAHWKKDKSAWTASWDAHWAKKRAACAAWKASWDAHWAKKKAHFHKSK